ncbi:GtrA family protein [Konateibacter massiliensis]|uniref:GtrA family protein n=1 Tax=Konateibacter massiliensis TaxID=2002841 RepID=UPI000C1625AF|nr:GtrA family protein [Konateibacter massiliensis]
MVIVIPAYEPDARMVEIVERLNLCTRYPIVIVNDGSSAEKISLFEKLKDYADIISHPKNLGKGEAMKTGLRYIARYMPAEDGVVFIDADGQHTAADMTKVIEKFYQDKNALVLGSREFTGKIPIKSLMGNRITRIVFYLLSRVSLKDTQTGLRAVSTTYIPLLLEIEGERYEYEMNMLLTFAKEGIKIAEVPIETIYADSSNSTSHFRAVRDSVRVYGVIFKFMTSSAVCALLDYVLFLGLIYALGDMKYKGTVILCNVLTRLVSAVTNYNLNKKFVFKKNNKKANYGIQYAILAISILGANSFILYLLTRVFAISPAIAKVLTEMLLFLTSFLVQQKVIFGRKIKQESVAGGTK